MTKHRKLPVVAIMLAMIGLAPIGIATLSKACSGESNCSNETCTKEDKYGGQQVTTCYYNSAQKSCDC